MIFINPVTVFLFKSVSTYLSPCLLVPDQHLLWKDTPPPGTATDWKRKCPLLFMVLMDLHFKGKYAVKHGTYEDLKPMCDAITDRGIGATVETVPV